jgi:hypothetical protein
MTSLRHSKKKKAAEMEINPKNEGTTPTPGNGQQYLVDG